MDAGPKFFIVWRESSSPSAYIPRIKHETYESACNEAKRLSAAHPGIRFVVLNSVIGFSSVAKMEVTLHTVEHKFGPARKGASPLKFGPPQDSADEPVQPDGSIDARRWDRA